MAKLGLAPTPMLALKVLINFGVGLVTGQQRMITNFNKKNKPTTEELKEKEEEAVKQFKTSVAAGKNTQMCTLTINAFANKSIAETS